MEKYLQAAHYGCWELVQTYYQQELGITLPDREDLTPEKEKRDWIRVDLSSCRQGDVITFREPVGRHVGIIIDRRLMLHSTTNIGPRLERYTGLLWRSKILSVYRHRSLM